MRRRCAAAAAAMLVCGAAAYCQTTGSCAQALETPLHDRAALVIQSIPAGITVAGTDSNKLRITCTSARDRDEVHLHLSGDPGRERLTIDSDLEHDNNLQIRIEVPHRTGLRLHMGAGQVTVNNLEGDKDIDLYAGQIVIAAGDTADYSSVDASVDIGEVKASAWGVDKGGFFRSFTRTTANGDYHLVAHVLTGEIDLQ
ncbi:MAG TPA: hypothetical protein VHU89_16625 [Acidobacteriaceae bacterium]|jgi:hypothetical protein|nr:hypothetical protein [Acidobacteriaceae bacterium]